MEKTASTPTHPKICTVEQVNGKKRHKDYSEEIAIPTWENKLAHKTDKDGLQSYQIKSLI